MTPRILDRKGAPGPHGCSWWAGGMLAPQCEGVTADAVITDTWVSMGDKEFDRRHNLLAPYQVNERLMAAADGLPETVRARLRANAGFYQL